MTVGVVGLEQERIGFDDLRQIQYDPELATGTCARSYPGDKTARRGKSGRQREVRIGQIDDKPVGAWREKTRCDVALERSITTRVDSGPDQTRNP